MGHAPSGSTGTVAFLHGGRPRGGQRVGRRYVPVRVIGALHRRLRPAIEAAGWSTTVLINTHRGWQVPGSPGVVAVEEAVTALRGRPGPLILVGHSMGARIALRVAARLAAEGGDVAGVVGVAPWLPAREIHPVGVRVAPAFPVTLIHGTLDVLTPGSSARLAAARLDAHRLGTGRSVEVIRVVGGEHSLLVRRGRWLTATGDAIAAMITARRDSGVPEGAQPSGSASSSAAAVRASIRASAPSSRC